VKGHRDKDEAFEQLTIPEKFNVFVDHLVTYALDLATITKAEPDPLFSQHEFGRFHLTDLIIFRTLYLPPRTLYDIDKYDSLLLPITL
jgi:hypothetical protein